ncbi:hypothetical protein ACKFKG_06465 [Phormidesmis sp. 146-35]
MYTFKCLDNAFAAIAYQSFTFPLYRSRLQAPKFAPSTVVIAAADTNNQAIGLALAEIHPDGRSATLAPLDFCKANSPSARRRDCITNSISSRIKGAGLRPG